MARCLLYSWVVLSTIVITFALLTESAAPTSATRVNATEINVSDIIAAQSAVGAGQGASAQQLARATNSAARSVAIARKAQQSLQGKRSSLRKSYNRQLAEIDKLSRQRASWNRDRQLSKKKSASAALAKELSALDKKLRNATRSLSQRRRKLLLAVESELAGSVGGKRATELRRLRNNLAKRLRRRARKIILPDASIDRLADPEELEEQAALIARAEKQLRAEDEKLEERYRYYSKQEKLRAQSERATEFASRDGENIRRSPGIGTSSRGDAEISGDSSPEAGAPGGNESDFEPPSGGGDDASRDLALESSSVVLADVVDDVTAADLRRAGRSAKPATRARAAKRARDQLRSRLERLRKQRKLIRKRAKQLRSR